MLTAIPEGEEEEEGQAVVVLKGGFDAWQARCVPMQGVGLKGSANEAQLWSRQDCNGGVRQADVAVWHAVRLFRCTL